MLNNNSNHNFFVSSYGNYWKLKSNNWTNVENGVENGLIDNIHDEKISDGKIHLVFVGSLMKHYRADVLKSALLLLDTHLFHLHLVGSKLDNLYDDLLKQNITVTHHGFKSRNELNLLISKFHIGVIAGGPEYNSNMKLFDYAIGKCAVIAPSIDVLQSRFKEDLYFFDGTEEDFAMKLDELIRNKNQRIYLSERLYVKISSEFTWDKIFSAKAYFITSKIH